MILCNLPTTNRRACLCCAVVTVTLRRTRSNLDVLRGTRRAFVGIATAAGLCPHSQTPSHRCLSHGVPHDAGQHRPDRQHAILMQSMFSGALLSQLATACVPQTRRAPSLHRAVSSSRASAPVAVHRFFSSVVITVIACRHCRCRRVRSPPPPCQRIMCEGMEAALLPALPPPPVSSPSPAPPAPLPPLPLFRFSPPPSAGGPAGSA